VPKSGLCDRRAILGRTGSDLFRRPTPRRRVDHAPPHHLRVRDRAFRRSGRRFLPAFGRHVGGQHPAGAPGSPGGDGGRPRLHGHADSADRGLGVGQLEVPEGGQSRRDHLRALDAHPEAPTRPRGAGRHRGLAGGRAHDRRRRLRRGRDRSHHLQAIGAPRPGRASPRGQHSRSPSPTPPGKTPPRRGRGRASCGRPTGAGAGACRTNRESAPAKAQKARGVVRQRRLRACRPAARGSGTGVAAAERRIAANACGRGRPAQPGDPETAPAL